MSALTSDSLPHGFGRNGLGRFLQTLLILILLLAFASRVARAGEKPSHADREKALDTRNMEAIRKAVETLRGKKFLHAVPVYYISEKEIRNLVDRKLAEEYPGRKLADYQDLLVWLDILPPTTDIKTVYSEFLVEQGAGMYDPESKEMCIPRRRAGGNNAKDKGGPKKTDAASDLLNAIVFSHEYTHALEDQYWGILDSETSKKPLSTDRSTAESFLTEGSATRLMIEAIPAQLNSSKPLPYAFAWNLLHSSAGEAALGLVLGRVWKASEMEVPGVPAAISRGEAMAYSYGYSFCTEVLRNWGLDGLDYIYDHQPVSSEQVMHPQKAWEWRDLPVQISLPESLAGGWRQLTGDSVGEAGVAVLFGCQLNNLHRGLQIARGWDGDRAGLYETPGGRRLLVWASAWDSSSDAKCFADFCLKERKAFHQAAITQTKQGHPTWMCADGRAGMLMRDGKRVILFETGSPAALKGCENWAQTITYTEPPEDAARAAANNPWLQYNPLLSRRVDGDYTVTKSGAGLLWRRDRNSIGVADRALFGLAGEARRTSSLTKWKLGYGLIAKHESETRRGVTRTTVLPAGLLWSHFSAVQPDDPTHTLSRTSSGWGLAGSRTSNDWERLWRILPGGLLFRSTTRPGMRAVHVLGTGLTVNQSSKNSGSITRFRLLGVPVWTVHSTAQKRDSDVNPKPL